MSTMIHAGEFGSGACKALGSAVIAALLLLPGAPAFACPVCHTETGAQVRAGIFGEDFGANLLVAAMPFPIFLGIAAALHFGAGSKPDGNPHKDSL